MGQDSHFLFDRLVKDTECIASRGQTVYHETGSNFMYTHSTSVMQDRALSEPSYFHTQRQGQGGTCFSWGKCNRNCGSMGGNAREPCQEESRME